MYVCCVFIAGNTEDKKVPTLVQAFADHKMVGVDCGSGDAHTLFLEDNGEYVTVKGFTCKYKQHVCTTCT